MNLSRALAVVLSSSVILAGGICSLKAEWNPDEANLKTGLANLPKLREESLRLLEESRKNSPERFKKLISLADERVAKFLMSDIRPIDMQNVLGASAGNYNFDVWRIVTIANDLFIAGEAYASSESRYASKGEVIAKSVQGFEYIYSIMKAAGNKPEGTSGCPDTNLDRFAYGPLWDAYILLGQYLPEDLKNRMMKLLLSAAKYQVETFGTRGLPWTGGYPNMDSAYILVLTQGYHLFGDKWFVQDLDKRVELLQQCFTGSTWVYLTGWNPAPGYTHVTLNWLGRAYQISKHPGMLKQLQAHAEYFKYFVEPNGLMDHGMSPFNKHAAWSNKPYGSIAGQYSMEIVHRSAPTPVLQKIINDAYDHVSLGEGWHLYWVSPNLGKTEDVPMNFVRTAPEFMGFQVRQTNKLGTMTVYATGRDFAIDTRVSAMIAAKSEEKSAILQGVFIEVLQDGASYYLGEINPQRKVEVSGNQASLFISQERRTMGPKSRPMIGTNNQAKDFKNWTFNVVKGGSPTGPPVVVAEKWVWTGERLNGEVSFTASQDTKLDGIRITLPTGGVASLAEKRQLPGGEAKRFGAMCVSWQGNGGRLVSASKEFDFRADVPEGEYTVTLVSGDPDNETQPFDVFANGAVAISGMAAPKGAMVERTFSLKVAENQGINLNFSPRGGDHWKVAALSIVSKDGRSYVKKFDVGPSKLPPMKGYERLSGSDVYSKERGYGWDDSLASQERIRGDQVVSLISDLITSPSLASEWEIQEGAEEWKKGRSVTLRISVGMDDSLEDWLQKK